jgi:GTPase SAR1 family protein
LKNSKIVILVYDITKKESYEQIVNFWYPKVIEVLGDEIIIGLAGNKSDLYENESISIDIVKEFSKEKNILFKETSAMNHDSVEVFFKELIEQFYEKNKNTIEQNSNVNLTKNNITDRRNRNNCC